MSIINKKLTINMPQVGIITGKIIGELVYKDGLPHIPIINGKSMFELIYINDRKMSITDYVKTTKTPMGDTGENNDNLR
jgi:hypothetical protein